MTITDKHRAYGEAMNFESVYDYSEQYKVNDNPTVWKYMSMEKFKSLIDEKALYFSKPSGFFDPLEGSYSYWDIKQRDTGGNTRDYMKRIQEFSAISCWHINDHESAAMWDLYLGGGDGIAIKTTYKDLYNSIHDPYIIFSGKLQYIDFNKDMTSENVFDTLFYKRKSFSFENELRLMIIASRIDHKNLEKQFENEGIPSQDWDGIIDDLEEKSYEFSHPNGNLVSCDLNNLIHSIYVSPKSPPEVVDKVKSMVKEIGMSSEIIVKSNLYEDYIY
ncbi:DUF2971 domain-containing protein [Peribacillus muralis]|uniref:DUF2971 domain-containing protein n=1 Tax=Peribacillus muralis TaxID=264697 RepID=UPI003804AF66